MGYDPQSEEFENLVRDAASKIQSVLDETAKVMVGQEHVARRLMMAAVAEGHVLLEGLPGLAKTTIIKTVADVCSLSFSRIQFTPDLLPADVIGTLVFDPKQATFNVKKGPIFAHLVLADEINRAPAKVQSALLEAMQERQVTIGDETYPLDRPFLVMATQNPIEQEGTYPLPEAQVDRFLFKVIVGYGTLDQEQLIMARAMDSSPPDLNKLMSGDHFKDLRKLALNVHVAEKVRKYIAELVFATRTTGPVSIPEVQQYIEVGASPRASINLELAARINALFDGRTYVTPQDIKDVGHDILRHRVLPSYEAEAENISSEQLVSRIFESVDVP